MVAESTDDIKDLSQEMSEKDDSVDIDKVNDNKAVMQQQSMGPGTWVREAVEEDKCGDRIEGEDNNY